MELILITGTCGVGKTTVAAGLGAKFKWAAIDADMITNWIIPRNVRMADNFQEGALARISAKAAEEFFGLGLNVIIEFPMSAKIVTFFQDHFGGKHNISAFWLWCRRDENHRRDELRPDSDIMGERLDVLLEELEKESWPAYLNKVDTTKLTSDQTIDFIAQNIGVK